jgi:hypothetical protein
MKSLLLYLTILLLFASGCESRRKQEAMEQRIAALNQKEQELLFKERALQLKEEELLRREAKIDSTLNTDTAGLVNPALVGNWSVKMSCIETTCTGYAVGDTKNEVWNISYQGNNILARAMAGHQLVRVYSGRLRGNTVELAEGRDSTVATPGTKMFVRLTMNTQNIMEGQREIIRENDCKVVYALELVKDNV